MNGIVFAAAYLLGSVTFGPIIAAVRGVDLRSVGSGNIGATNALRAMGKGPAVLVLAGDVLKGVLGVALGVWFGGEPHGAGGAAIAVVLGHDFSVFTGFRGGKGVATSIGALLVLAPKVGGAFVLVWLVVFALSRVSSLSALTAFAAMPVIIYLDSPHLTYVGVALAGLGFLKHRGNIRRLLKGEETGIGKRP